MIMKSSGYDARTLSYMDWAASLASNEMQAQFVQAGIPVVSTNLDVQDPQFQGAISKSVILTTNSDRRIAVLSLTSPQPLAATKPIIASKMSSNYERVLNSELGSLRRSGYRYEEAVVAIISLIPISNADTADTGRKEQAKAAAINAVMTKVVGVNVYILGGFSGLRESNNGSAYTIKNWAGDNVLVVPLQLTSEGGKAVEVVKVVFNNNGSLKPEFSGSHSVAVTCTVPESTSVRTLVNDQEALREESMSAKVGETTSAVRGLALFGKDNVITDTFNIEGSDYCVILQNLASGDKVGKCGCRVSQCEAGSLVTDAMRSAATGADFAVVNGGAIRAGLPEGAITQAHVHQMVPFLDELVRIDNVSGSTVKEMLDHSIAALGAPEVTTDPNGRYLQVSQGIRFTWHFEGSIAKIGSVEICRIRNATNSMCQERDFEYLSVNRNYTVAVSGFLANGGDGYSMLRDGYSGQSQTRMHKSQYDVVVSHFGRLQSSESEGNSTVATDFVANHKSTPKSSQCPSMDASQRVCQTNDVVQIPLGLYCRPVTEGYAALQECDQAYHMVEVINNKLDGFYDDLLPDARLVLHENHVNVGCSVNQARSAHKEMLKVARQSNTDQNEMFVAVIGPACSNDVEDLTEKSWRDAGREGTRDTLIVSGSSTASTLADDIRYPNLARLATSEKGIAGGLAFLCRKYGWKRVAIVHDSSTWGTDSARNFEYHMLKDESVANELIYMDFQGLERSQCDSKHFDDDQNVGRRGKIMNAKIGCDPLTSFSVEKVRNAYPRGEDQCEPNNQSHFCVEKILEELKLKDAKVIFVAAQRDTQLALFRALYRNRDDPLRDLHGDGYAWMSALIGEELFVGGDGAVDEDALLGLMGTLGVKETTDIDSPTFQDYTTLWGAASAPEACCSQESGGMSNANVINSEVSCKRASSTTTTVKNKPFNYCDTDGDGSTGASYSFSVADGILSIARALDYNTIYLEDPQNSDRLYKDLLAYSADTQTEKGGVTGSIYFEPDSGDRDGDLEFVNLQTYTIDSDKGQSNRKRRFIVELQKSVAAFVVVAKYKISSESGERVYVPELDANGDEKQIVFPGGGLTAPVDDTFSYLGGLRVTNSAKAVGTVIGIFAVLMAVGVVVYKHRLRHLKMRAHDFQKQLKDLAQAGVIDEEYRPDENSEKEDRLPREIKRSHITTMSVLGSGKFGDVYSAVLNERKGEGYSVAVKTTKEADGEGADEIRLEALVMAQLADHVNVAELIGVVTSGTPLLLVLQIYENGSLLSCLKEKKFPGQDHELEGYLPPSTLTTARIAFEIAQGMAYIARALFVHRDLAARNILLDLNFVCKIADFGLSRGVKTGHQDDEEDYYRSENSAFPIRWTDPEALQAHKFTAASDVWSFGVVLMEIVQGGKRPYNHLRNDDVMKAVINGQTAPQPKKGCTDELYSIISQCWQLLPKNRPTFEQLIPDLEKQLEDAMKHSVVDLEVHKLTETDIDSALSKRLSSLTLAAAAQKGKGVIFQSKTNLGQKLAAKHGAVLLKPKAKMSAKEKEEYYSQKKKDMYKRVLSKNCELVEDELGSPFEGIEDVILVGLYEAIEAARAHSSDGFADRVEEAFAFAESLVDAGESLGLSIDEAAAINFYTAQCLFYVLLNGVLGGWGKDGRKPVALYLPYCKLALTALNKLPNVEATVYRGVQGVPLATLLGGKNEGHMLTWWAFTSTTESSDVLRNPHFLGFDGDDRTVFVLKIKSGVRIKRFSNFGGDEISSDDEENEGISDEDEVLIKPGTQFLITDITEFPGGVTQVSLTEVVDDDAVDRVSSQDEDGYQRPKLDMKNLMSDLTI